MPKDENDAVGVCTECHSDQPDQAMYRDPFAQSGGSPACRFCGGVVIITLIKDRERTLNQIDRERGL